MDKDGDGVCIEQTLLGTITVYLPFYQDPYHIFSLKLCVVGHLRQPELT